MLNSLKSLYNRTSQAWTDLKALAKKDLSTLWNEYRTVFVLLGAVIFALKFRQWFIDLIVSGSKQLVQSSQTKSQSLETKENSDNKAADILVQEAQALPGQEKPVASDWYKNQK